MPNRRIVTEAFAPTSLTGFAHPMQDFWHLQRGYEARVHARVLGATSPEVNQKKGRDAPARRSFPLVSWARSAQRWADPCEPYENADGLAPAPGDALPGVPLVQDQHH